MKKEIIFNSSYHVAEFGNDPINKGFYVEFNPPLDFNSDRDYSTEFNNLINELKQDLIDLETVKIEQFN